jgi:type II secretory pathway component PulJ
MASSKYRFNPETIRYERISYPLHKKLVSLIPYILSIVFFSLLFLFLLDNHVNSPKAIRMLSKQEEIETKLNLLESDLRRMEIRISSIQNNDDHIYRTYFEVPPLTNSQRDAGFGGNSFSDIFQETRYSGKLASLNRKLDMIGKKLVVQSKSFDEVVEMALSK